ncbi:hypothetical protein CTTA_4887 [Comamonas testosteroni]|uniref:Uncharacterized protein n=1 Tax=Comamonas testosteroni TaxID=285 RepID=A0A5A7MJM9_COMTE|nr:hypothetical protein [Comamonas testosteroni]GEQ77882.1 hypothetical protein CTTA_4887 [Comamonas testosteroni]
MAQNNEAMIAELLRKVVNDPHAAAELLALAADYLKSREPLPDALADYLAHAFRRAATTPPPDNDRSSGEGKSLVDERIARLIEGLCMKRESGAPRKEVPKGKIIAGLMIYGDKAEQEQGWRKKIAEEHGLAKNTAKARIQEAREERPKAEAEAKERTQKILEANELLSLIRKR